MTATFLLQVTCWKSVESCESKEEVHPTARSDAPLLFMMCVDDCLVCCLKFLQEADIILGEETEILDLVFEVGDTLNTHTERIAFIFG